MSQTLYEELRDANPVLRQRMAEAARVTILLKKNPRDRRLHEQREDILKDIETQIKSICADHGKADVGAAVFEHARQQIDPLAENILGALAKLPDRYKLKPLVRAVIITKKTGQDAQTQKTILDRFLDDHLSHDEVSIVHDFIHVLHDEHELEDILSHLEPTTSTTTFRR